MLSMPSGPSSPRLSSPKSFRAICSCCEESGKASSSPEERSTTDNPSEGSTCSYGGHSDPRGEISDEEADGGEDLVGEGGGKAALDEEEDPLTFEREHLMPLLSSIVHKWRKGAKKL
jgi:hypothetical protein